MTDCMTPPSWFGWLRLSGQKWHAVVEAATYDEAMAKLFAHQYPGRRRDITVLLVGCAFTGRG